MKDKHYHYLVSYFWKNKGSNGDGVTAINIDKKLTEKLILECNKKIAEKENDNCDYFINGFYELECDCEA